VCKLPAAKSTAIAFARILGDGDTDGETLKGEDKDGLKLEDGDVDNDGAGDGDVDNDGVRDDDVDNDGAGDGDVDNDGVEDGDVDTDGVGDGITTRTVCNGGDGTVNDFPFPTSPKLFLPQQCTPPPDVSPHVK
jgi:hypothetical protein